eukprot:NP_497380.1 F-box A protein [Caenorhabditis elegans]
MPLEIADQVLEKLQPVDLLTCRKVCQSLRTAVDKFGITFDKDLGIILSRVSKFNLTNHTKNKRDSMKSLIKALKTKKFVCATKIYFYQFRFNEILSILPYFNPKVLEDIEMWYTNTTNRFERIANLDQWKNAKTFEFWSARFNCEHLEYLFNLEEFSVKMGNVSVESAIRIRDNLLPRSTFKKCIIWFNSINQIELATVFQPGYFGRKEYTFNYSNQTNTFAIECSELMSFYHKFSIDKC